MRLTGLKHADISIAISKVGVRWCPSGFEYIRYPLLLYNVFMLSRMDARIARKVKRRLLKVTPVKRLIVYGSRARGKAA